MSEVTSAVIVMGCFGLQTVAANSKIGIMKYDTGALLGLGESLDFHSFSVSGKHS